MELSSLLRAVLVALSVLLIEAADDIKSYC